MTHLASHPCPAHGFRFCTNPQCQRAAPGRRSIRISPLALVRNVLAVAGLTLVLAAGFEFSHIHASGSWDYSTAWILLICGITCNASAGVVSARIGDR